MKFEFGHPNLPEILLSLKVLSSPVATGLAERQNLDLRRLHNVESRLACFHPFLSKCRSAGRVQRLSVAHLSGLNRDGAEPVVRLEATEPAGHPFVEQH